jgi:hypothetical protein
LAQGDVATAWDETADVFHRFTHIDDGDAAASPLRVEFMGAEAEWGGLGHGFLG